MEKDYSLLRPFNLEAARAGDKITTLFAAKHMESTTHWVWVAGPDQFDRVVTQHFQGELCTPVPVGSLRMLPLCWVEGKPVYTGDCLWRVFPRSYDGYNVVVEGVFKDSSQFSYISYRKNDGKSVLQKDGSVSDLMWKKPKQKREAWLNIYPKLGSFYNAACETDKYPFATQDIADKYAERGRVACLRIEWEE